MSLTISNPRILIAGAPIGLAPAGRTACVLPLIFPNANPDETLLYGIDFVQRLAGSADSAITSFIVSTMPGANAVLVPANESVDGSQALFTLSGGVAGVEYLVVVAANTSSGQVMVANATLYVQPAPVLGTNGVA